MNQFSIKLLVTLVLLILAATSAGLTSQADARGLSGPGASSRLSATCPGADVASGEPDAGTGGIAPPPPSSQKQLRGILGSGTGAGVSRTDWINWTGRIWATLVSRIAR
jgi:hypothetical protein